MTSEKLKVRFRLNDKNKPVDCFAERKTAANMLVEEFTLLTNLTVARIIAHGLQDQALLRRHEAPVERRIEGFVKRAAKLGYNFDSTDAASIQKGFDAVRDQDVSLCLELLKRRAMFGARYFCTGMLDIAKYGHWALNVPLYTHFTSPIRRYADVLVHRMLDACITAPNKDDVKFLMDRDQVAKCAQQCNMKKGMSQTTCGSPLADTLNSLGQACRRPVDSPLPLSPYPRPDGKVWSSNPRRSSDRRAGRCV